MKNGIKKFFYKFCSKPKSVVQIVQPTEKENIVSYHYFNSVVSKEKYEFLFYFESELKHYDIKDFDVTKEKNQFVFKTKNNKLILIIISDYGKN
jgi:3-dehydroquinate dehydratase